MGPNQSPQAAPRTSSDRFAYHKVLLRKLDFALDLESADSFTPKLDISYAWSKPDYKYTQYIHKSGLLFAQIISDDNRDSDFLLLPNRLAPRTSSKNTSSTPSVDDIIKTVRAFCQDLEGLRAFYEEASRPKAPPAPSPFNAPVWRLDGADADVPPISLPPHLAHRSGLGDLG